MIRHSQDALIHLRFCSLEHDICYPCSMLASASWEPFHLQATRCSLLKFAWNRDIGVLGYGNKKEGKASDLR